MNGKKAKLLRRLAATEMATDKGVVQRELVVSRINGFDRVVNDPNSVKAFNMALKKNYIKLGSGR